MQLKIMRSIVIILLMFALTGISAQTSNNERPNIVFIIADDLSSDDLSCYGNKGVKTPNLQKIAENGIIFNNAFLTAANCSPSRASIVTGRYPVSNGQTDLSTGALPSYGIPWPTFFDGIDYFPELLKNDGYYTAQSGKLHIGYHWLSASGPAKKGFVHADSKGGQSGAENWVNLLKGRPMDKPFFMWFAAHDPHDPWTAPKVHSPEDVEVPPYIPDTQYMRKQLAKYYDEIYRMDSYIGDVVEELKNQNVYDNTIIVFIADNGRAFWRSKGHIYDAGMKTPLIVSWPTKVESNQSGEQLISTIDLAPTFIEIAGLNPNDYTFQGRSILKNILDVNSPNLNKYVFSEQNWHGYANHFRSVRDTDGYVYVWNGRPDRSGIGTKAFVDYMVKLNDSGELTDIQKDLFVYPRNEEEMYHFFTDIHQTENLVGNVEYKKKLNELRKAFKKWKKLTGDRMTENEVPDWYQRPYSDEEPKTGVWGDPPGTRNFGVGKENKIHQLTKY